MHQLFRAVSIVPEYMTWIFATALAATLLYAIPKRLTSVTINVNNVFRLFIAGGL